jgi:hypothetical protein
MVKVAVGQQNSLNGLAEIFCSGKHLLRFITGIDDCAGGGTRESDESCINSFFME